MSLCRPISPLSRSAISVNPSVDVRAVRHATWPESGQDQPLPLFHCTAPASHSHRHCGVMTNAESELLAWRRSPAPGVPFFFANVTESGSGVTDEIMSHFGAGLPADRFWWCTQGTFPGCHWLEPARLVVVLVGSRRGSVMVWVAVSIPHSSRQSPPSIGGLGPPFRCASVRAGIFIRVSHGDGLNSVDVPEGVWIVGSHR